MNFRQTPNRTALLTALKQAKEPLSASALQKKLPSIDLVTIYRNLDLFVREKIIKRVDLGTDVALYEYQQAPHHHAVCGDCERVIHFAAPDEKIKKLLGLDDFEIHDLEVTVRGVCKK